MDFRIRVPKTCTDPYCIPQCMDECIGCPDNGKEKDDEDEDD